jgi:hypothetical protein
MTVIATDSARFSAVVKYEFEPQLSYCRESVVINDAAQTIKVGTVMGKVTAGGKWKVCQTNAADGSQNPAGIYVAQVNGLSTDLALAATTDTPALLIVRGPVILADAGLAFGAANAPTTAAVKTAFAALTPPVLVETAV